MDNITNSLQIKTLDAAAHNAPRDVLAAIQTASSKTGVDFSYLVKQASVESSFDTDAKNRKSSATGLYQFIDSTWLQMVDRYGDDFGIDTEGKSKREILALRKDPEASSFMAAAFASENERTLNDNWGGKVGETELYLAHFMGANGASSFLNARDENPLRPAADLFPAAARSNRAVFYDSETGKPRSLQEVYNFFDQKFQGQDVPDQAQIAQNSSVTSEDLLAMQATNQNGSIVPVDRTALSQSVVMVRAQAMREAAAAGQDTVQTGYGQIAYLGYAPTTITKPSQVLKTESANAQPFYSLIARNAESLSILQSADDTQKKWG